MEGNIIIDILVNTSYLIILLILSPLALVLSNLDEKVKKYKFALMPMFLFLVPFFSLFLIFKSKDKEKKESFIKALQDFYKYEIAKNPPEMEN
ncbi:MAG: hypothetical protein DRN01_07155 [Thermoplasmata archaeon]|nr:MAG: hypothetical protein DRN01_07155 [Thermoplasmata archaeon]RLF29689.1 MAG: hypothetical protein DRJ99_03400 [Thermoplasmata archaeon]